MVKKKENEFEQKQKMTFSKKWINIILSFSVVWISLSYILAFLNKADIAQELSKQIVVVVIATLISYFVKSFFETREEENNKLIKESFGNDNNTNDLE